MCVCVDAHVTVSVGRGQRTDCGSWLPSSAMSVLGTEFRASSLPMTLLFMPSSWLLNVVDSVSQMLWMTVESGALWTGIRGAVDCCARCCESWIWRTAESLTLSSLC